MPWTSSESLLGLNALINPPRRESSIFFLVHLKSGSSTVQTGQVRTNCTKNVADPSLSHLQARAYEILSFRIRPTGESASPLGAPVVLNSSSYGASARPTLRAVTELAGSVSAFSFSAKLTLLTREIALLSPHGILSSGSGCRDLSSMHSCQETSICAADGDLVSRWHVAEELTKCLQVRLRKLHETAFWLSRSNSVMLASHRSWTLAADGPVTFVHILVKILVLVPRLFAAEPIAFLQRWMSRVLPISPRFGLRRWHPLHTVQNTRAATPADDLRIPQ